MVVVVWVVVNAVLVVGVMRSVGDCGSLWIVALVVVDHCGLLYWLLGSLCWWLWIIVGRMVRCKTLCWWLGSCVLLVIVAYCGSLG